MSEMFDFPSGCRRALQGFWLHFNMSNCWSHRTLCVCVKWDQNCRVKYSKNWVTEANTVNSWNLMTALSKYVRGRGILNTVDCHLNQYNNELLLVPGVILYICPSHTYISLRSIIALLTYTPTKNPWFKKSSSSLNCTNSPISLDVDLMFVQRQLHCYKRWEGCLVFHELVLLICW